LLTLTLRDLQFRLRQFSIAVVGAALVFTVLLILTGISEGFNTEAEDTVDAIDVDAWIVPEGVTGPFAAISTLPAGLADQLQQSEGVKRAVPMVMLSQNLKRENGEQVQINVIGVLPGGPGAPEAESGENLDGKRQAVLDDATEVGVGESLTISDQRFEAVGQVKDRTYLGGIPVTYVTLQDAQQLAFDGQRLANTIVVRGEPNRVPRGYTRLSNEQVVDDMVRPLDGARQVIDTIRVLMWIVAAVIIGAVMYLSALERLRDFAVLKAVGGESRSLALGLCLQAIIAALIAAVMASILSVLLRPLFPVPVTIGVSAYLILAGVALVVGIVASIAALRRVLKVDPALAFG
jgi:putative ABC transport system permease protein